MVPVALVAVVFPCVRLLGPPNVAATAEVNVEIGFLRSP